MADEAGPLRIRLVFPARPTDTRPDEDLGNVEAGSESLKQDPRLPFRTLHSCGPVVTLMGALLPMHGVS